ncbi:MAG: 23S rRNA (adenine(2503)-C(2))-methyltransferase RlmN [Planctomycetota bacterium]
MPLAELKATLAELGAGTGLALPLWRGLFRFGADQFCTAGERGLSLGASTPRALAARGIVPLKSQVRAAEPSADGTIKLLVELEDGLAIETVVLRAKHGHGVCLSTQVGCAVGCVFCASGLRGVVRNLTACEIAEQVALARRYAPVDRLVIMGMGEPLLNLDQVLGALAIVKTAAGIGDRRVILSTIGVPARIDALAAMQRRWTLALSLHSARDQVRRRLIPASAHRAADVVAAARRYVERTGRACLIEIAVLRDINDSQDEAHALAELLAELKACVNLIPWNPVADLPFAAPEPIALERMRAILTEHGLHTTIRRSLGPDVAAACGQLVHRRG